jgi:hypothetical protein
VRLMNCERMLIEYRRAILLFRLRRNRGLLGSSVQAYAWTAFVREYGKAKLYNRFSVYIFERAVKDEDVLEIGYVLEQMTKVRESLQPYIGQRTEVVDV